MSAHINHLFSYIFILFLVSFFFFGCGDSNAKYEQISQIEAKRIMDMDNDCLILDVRTHEEYNIQHIKNAICIPNDVITSSERPYDLPNLDQIILVYCQNGNRSKDASQKLANMGYTNIKEFGGISTWEYDTQ